MYSQIYLLEIENPEDNVKREYIIDYNGNETDGEIKELVEKYIKTHRKFYAADFSELYLNDTSFIWYHPDVDKIKVSVSKQLMDINTL